MCSTVSTTKAAPNLSTPGQSKKPVTIDEDVRLPKSLRPLTYNLEIQPNLYGEDPNSFTFDGKLTIKISCKEETNIITLHGRDLDIPHDSIKFQPEVMGDPSYGKATFVSLTEDINKQFLTFTLSDNLVPGKNYLLEMTFSGPLKTDLKGLYLSSYQEEGKTR